MQGRQGVDRYTDEQHLEPTDTLPKYVTDIHGMKMLVNNEIPPEFTTNAERLALIIHFGCLDLLFPHH